MESLYEGISRCGNSWGVVFFLDCEDGDVGVNIC